jgi:hypothetical protein
LAILIASLSPNVDVSVDRDHLSPPHRHSTVNWTAVMEIMPGASLSPHHQNGGPLNTAGTQVAHCLIRGV